MKTKPSQTSYFTGDSLNTAGLVLTALYSDGSSQEVRSGFSCNPTQLSSAGSKTITVTYGGKTASFNVDVSEVVLTSFSVKTMPNKTEYFTGDNLDTTGMVLTARYNNGSSQDISSGFNCNPTSFSSAGTTGVVVMYGGKSAIFDVNVKEPVLNGIRVINNPTQTSYYAGQNLRTAGLVLVAEYSNGDRREVNSGFSCSPTKLNSAGTQTITVNYQGKTATFGVSVKDNSWNTTKPSGVSDSQIETKTQYRYADKETRVSTTPNLSGYNLVSSRWKQIGSGTIDYASFPWYFNKSSSQYSQYNKSVKSNSETQTKKVEVYSERISYIYWHWCTGKDFGGGPYNRFIGLFSGDVSSHGTHNTWHAFQNASNFTQYNPEGSFGGSDTKDGATFTIHYRNDKSMCYDTYWWYQLPVMRQTRKEYTKEFTYERWGNWSGWGDSYVGGNSNRKVETRTLYRVRPE